jgi:hypothetical protein
LPHLELFDQFARSKYHLAMTPIARLIVGAVVVVLIVVVPPRLLPQQDRAGGPGQVFSVAQFVQPGTGPLWTTKHKTQFLIRGVLRRVPMQPVADFVLSDNGSTRTGSGGLALASGPRDGLVSYVLRVPLLRPLLPPTPDNPVLGRPATYRIVWIGCPAYGCSHSPWQLDSGGA